MKAERLRQLATRWANSAPAERANAQLYLTELADALGVERPRPAGGGYCFEFPVRVVARDGTETVNFIDLYKQGHFILEAKDQERGPSEGELLRRAFGQARAYAAFVPGDPPPYLLVLDVAKSLLIWDRWSGTYGGFNAARQVALASLAERPDDVALLVDIFEDPAARDPRARAVAVTRDIAEKLAGLAASLEQRGHQPEVGASFLIRCVFTMFAEDIGLIQDHPFQTAVTDIGLRDPAEFSVAVTELWHAMDGGLRFGLRQLLRFNGHFFRDASSLPLTQEDMVALHEASLSDWASVEPSIFGTLLTRALDPAERHRLGAEFTPRPYVERVIRPTIEAPVRERWTLVQAEALQLNRTGRRRDRENALGRLRHFHEWLRSLRILDPACGSGNFLYVALHTLKRIEFEVLRMIEEIAGHPELAIEEVGPWQFHGIEVKPWAREVAELCLWAGHFQAWRELHGHAQPPEPVLRDTGNLECRDAVLAWDDVRIDPARARPDPTPREAHPVTGVQVPASGAMLPFYEYVGARPADWPLADFIIGNPPYMGRARQRDAFGSGYVEALRDSYPGVPEDADYVMYWWYRAACEVAAGRALRAGLITTNTIRQAQQRQVVVDAEADGARVIWAVADHPWVDETGSADVRVSMTVIAADEDIMATLVRVSESGDVVSESHVPRLNADLSAHVDVPRAASQPLLANRGLAANGFNVVGRGFVLEPEEAERLLDTDPRHSEIIRPHLNGRDLAGRPRGVWIIDFAARSEEEAKAYPVLYQIVRDRVLPERRTNSDRIARERWWRFARNRDDFRQASAGLSKYIATPYVNRRRMFTFLSAEIAPDDALRVIASDDPFLLGVLSSRPHIVFAEAAGGRLGVGNDPRYNQTLCFNPFPFPIPDSDVRREIGRLAERIDAHRKEALQRDAAVTMTGMYNVIVKLSTGESLTPTERRIHELAACELLADLHRQLDLIVACAYGWDWPLENEEILARVVALHDERLAEEANGVVRWLRPSFQRPRFGEGLTSLELTHRGEEVAAIEPQNGRKEWPRGAAEQIRALQEILAAHPSTADAAASQFRGARIDIVTRHLDTLVLIGEARAGEDGTYHIVAEPT